MTPSASRIVHRFAAASIADDTFRVVEAASAEIDVVDAGAVLTQLSTARATIVPVLLLARSRRNCHRSMRGETGIRWRRRE